MAFVTTPGGRGVAGRLFGPVISLPAVRHTATVIMLHGLVRIYSELLVLQNYPTT
jgi:hypothetical protein